MGQINQKWHSMRTLAGKLFYQHFRTRSKRMWAKFIVNRQTLRDVVICTRFQRIHALYKNTYGELNLFFLFPSNSSTNIEGMCVVCDVRVIVYICLKFVGSCNRQTFVVWLFGEKRTFDVCGFGAWCSCLVCLVPLVVAVWIKMGFSHICGGDTNPQLN